MCGLISVDFVFVFDGGDIVVICDIMLWISGGFEGV